MTNIAHVNKYEQAAFPGNIWKLAFFANLLIWTLIGNTCCTYAKEEKTGLQNKKELSLEINEKFYKKEAILKFNKAVEKWEDKDTSEAIKNWEEAIKIDPNLWVAHLGLGQAYDLQKDYKKALDSYNQYLSIAPSNAPERSSVIEAVKYLSHLLRKGEEALNGNDYFELIKTKHQGKELYTRWDLSAPIKIYFYPTDGISNYRKEYKEAFLEGAMLWQEAIPDLKFEVLENKWGSKDKKVVSEAQITVVFPSRFKIKGDTNNPIAAQIEAQSFPTIRDKKNFRVLGVIMISPYTYHQAQIAISLEPLSKLNEKEQIEKLKSLSAREIGHTLGLWGFSPNPDDLMFEGEVKEFKLSERDKNTIKKLYNLNPEKGEVLTNSL